MEPVVYIQHDPPHYNRFHIRKGCEEKEAYTKKAPAEEHARRVHGVLYRCVFCGNLHVTVRGQYWHG